MFWFLFSWFIGRWGPKISCTKTQTFPNLGFLIPLIMSQVSNCLVLGRLFSHITASQHYPTIFNQLHKIESLPHRVGSSYVCASILCKFCLFLIFTWLTSHCVCVWVDKRVTNEAHHVVKVMNWWCYDMICAASSSWRAFWRGVLYFLLPLDLSWWLTITRSQGEFLWYVNMIHLFKWGLVSREVCFSWVFT